MSSDAAVARARPASRAVLVLALVLGIFLQVQGSFFLPGAGAKGLRLNLADLILPLAGMVVIYSLATGRSHLPRWRMAFGYLWLGVLTLVLTLALGHSYALYGHINNWAVTNKFAGWFVLLAYLGLGGWLAANYGAGIRDAFLASFAGAFLAVLCVLLALTVCGIYSAAWGAYPRMIELQGFMGNRNAYAFLAMAVSILVTMRFVGDTPGGVFRIAAPILWFVLPLAAYYNGSRTLLVTSALLLVVLLVWRPRETARMILPPLLAGLLLCGVMNHVHPRPVIKGQAERTLDILRLLSSDPTALAQARKLASPNTSEAVRLRVLQDALALWRTHPLAGTGLGSFWDVSQKKYAGTGRIVEIIDCTPLWLLTETGLAGLAIFCAFFASVLYTLAGDVHKCGVKERAFLQSVIILLACFAVMSLFQELLYTRFLWFIMGMAFARTKDATELPA